MRRVLVSGGTGSFGTKFIQNILDNEPNIERVVVYSRDELKQWELQQSLPLEKYPQMRFFIGDVRDKERLLRALEGIDTVVHAAALKQVPAAPAPDVVVPLTTGKEAPLPPPPVPFVAVPPSFF